MKPTHIITVEVPEGVPPGRAIFIIKQGLFRLVAEHTPEDKYVRRNYTIRDPGKFETMVSRIRELRQTADELARSEWGTVELVESNETLQLMEVSDGDDSQELLESHSPVADEERDPPGDSQEADQLGGEDPQGEG